MNQGAALINDSDGFQCDTKRMFHEFTVTDPVLQGECYPDIPLPGEPPLSVDISLGGPTYVCISLTPPWRGRQYKIAAGFVRLSADAYGKQMRSCTEATEERRTESTEIFFGSRGRNHGKRGIHGMG